MTFLKKTVFLQKAGGRIRNKTIPKLLPDLPCIYFNLDRNECVKEIRKPNEFIEDTDYDYEILDVELEPYNKTLYRLWDWGFKNIVDKESYEKIKDYL